ncbi:MGDG synthase family glycosyltransferase [Chitinilyticum litopenaei]|uniref:MGDG synthase family glycosyltransferase n=1 Tax=Chitinilyticum litopenaei TaxID=1121276 RepID=UPI00049059AB|nr:glycosyltransferase [Chitinilyticum litopenaei]
MSTPLLLLHATAGAGHTRAAQAVATALEQAGSPGHRVVDTLQCTTAFFRKMYAKAYIDLVQTAPGLWGHLYERYDVVKPPRSKTARSRLAFDKVNSRAFGKLLAEARPQAILCTHFLPLELLSDLRGRGKLDTPVHAVVTDVSPHAFWVYPHIDVYHVATPAGARELARKGIDAQRIRVSGIPIDPIFAQQTPAATQRAALGLPERATVLLLSGGFGVGPLLAMLDSFGADDAGLSVVVVAGRNAELEAACRARAATMATPVTVYGFVSNIHELMDAADLVVTKPGGLTTNEILAKGKPMALVAPIPGQEQRNCEYLLEEGAAVRLYDAGDAAWFFRTLLDDHARMAAMRAACARIARPQAAADIAAALLAALRMLPA